MRVFYPALTGAIAALVLMASGIWSPIHGAEAMSELRQGVEVEDDVIRLGDLFSNTGDRASIIVRSAPGPGERIILSTRELLLVSRANDLQWFPPQLARQVVVSRAALWLDATDLAGIITDVLPAHGFAADHEVRLFNRKLKLALAPDQDPSVVSVASLDHDARTGRFKAKLAINENAGSRNLLVSGQLVRQIHIPVLKSQIAKGQIIRDADLTWLKMDRTRVGQTVVQTKDQLIGNEPRRALQAMTLIRETDIRRPVTVAKNTLVTMMVQSAGLSLSATGKALESGATGDVIRVINPASHQTVEATIIDKDRVRVVMPNQAFKIAQVN